MKVSGVSLFYLVIPLFFLITPLMWSQVNLELNYPFVASGTQTSGSNWSIDIDEEGNTYVTGDFRGELDFDPGPGTNIKGPNGGIFVTRWNADGSYAWTQTFVDSNHSPKPTDIDVYNNIVYVCGTFQGLDAGIGGLGSVRSVSSSEEDPDAVSADVCILAIHTEDGAPLLGFGPDFNTDGTGDGVQIFGGSGGENAFGLLAEGPTIFCVGNLWISERLGFGGVGGIMHSTNTSEAFIIAVNGITGNQVEVFSDDGIVFYQHPGNWSAARDLVVVDNVAWVCGNSGSPKKNTRWWIKAWDSVDGQLVGPENVIDEWTVDYSEAMRIIHHNGFLYVAGEYENTTTDDDVELGLPGTGKDDIFVWAYDLNVQNPLIGFGLDLDFLGEGNGLQTFGGSGDDIFSDIVAIGDNLYILGTTWSTDAGIGGHGSFSVPPPLPNTDAFVISLDSLLGQPNADFSNDGVMQLFSSTFDTGFALGAAESSLVIGGVGAVVDGENGGFLFSMPSDPIDGLLTITPVDEQASEFPLKSASFEISRELNQSFDSLEVIFDISGKAGWNSDFAITPNPVRFNNFQRSVLVSLDPIQDAEPEGTETVSLAITPNEGFQMTNLEPLTFSFTDRPADQWQWDFFHSQGTPELAGDNLDADGDGISNLLEYAMAANPIQANTEPPFVAIKLVDSGNKFFGIRYFEDANLSDVELILEVSNDLSTWVENSPNTEDQVLEISRTPMEDRFLVESVNVNPFDANIPQFIRLKARRKP